MFNVRLTIGIGLVILAAANLPTQASERNSAIRSVGSSTVFPFVAAAAERFGRKDGMSTPIVESTGTGGGFKLFCQSAKKDTPSISNASRQIKASEVALCAENGVNEIVELKIGYDGIVMAGAATGPAFNLTKRHLFLALSHYVPKGGKLVDNPYHNWKDIDPSLPDNEILIYGPPPTSGTRDAFVELVMEEACEHFDLFKTTYADKKIRKQQCALMREDGVFVEAGENDNIIVQKLTASPYALGIFGFSFLDQNAGTIKGNPINGINPTFDAIASGEYNVARSLFVYIKKAHIETSPYLHDFVRELTSEAAIGEEGYLTYKGLIPLPENEFNALQDIADKLPPVTVVAH